MREFELIRSILAVFLGFIIVYIFRNMLFDFLKAPYCEFLATPDGQESAGTGLVTESDCPFLIREPLEGFSTVISLVGYGGLILAFPAILYQLGRFVMPGLY
nr:twin-arginine translocase subunit TatC [Phycisphaeraceae bacterium]